MIATTLRYLVTPAALVLAFSLTAGSAATAGGHSLSSRAAGVNVTISYSILMSGNYKDPEASKTLQEKGRRVIYGMAKSECTVLKENIAETCSLKRLSVTTRPSTSRYQPEGITITGNATYQITPKN